METQFGKALSDLSGLAKERWYAVFGFLGALALFFIVLLGTPFDDFLTTTGSAAFMFFGFGNAEIRNRTFKSAITDGVHHLIQVEVIKWTVTGVCMFISALTCAVAFGLRIAGIL